MKYFLGRLLRKVGVSKFINLNWAIRVNGKSVRVPLLRGMGVANLAGGERWLSEIIGRLLPEQGMLVDVGANVGQSLIKAKTLVPGARYIGFEPNPACAWYLQELILANRYDECTIIPSGLSDGCEILELSFYTRNPAEGSASLVADFRPTTKILGKRHVAVFRFDDIAGNLGLSGIDLIKIDVEGAELAVLRGLEQSLSKYRPVIIMEVLPAYSAEHRDRISRQQQICDYFADNNYDLFRIMKNRDNSLRELLSIDRIEIHSDLALCDYVGVPQEVSSEVFKVLKAN